MTLIFPCLRNAFLIFLIAILAGCGKRKTPVELGIQNGTLHVGIGAEPQSLDPHLTTGEIEHTIQKSLFEGLLIPDGKTGEPSPGVASHWEVSDDHTIYTFHLRPEATWSDGRPVTAQDFIYSFRRALSPALAAKAAIQFYYVEGAKDYGEGVINDFSDVGFKALDNQTLQVSLLHPFPHMLKLAMHSSWMPVRVDEIEKYGRIDERGTKWTMPGNLVGNGPFNLTNWKQNELIQVSKSATYWDAEQVMLNEIYFYPIDNVNSEERAFRSGRLHLTNYSSGLPLSRLDYYLEEQADHMWLKSISRNYFLLINPENAPFDDVRVRRALSLVLDREALADQVMKGVWTPAYNLVPPGLSGYEAGKQFESDPEKARQLLSDAGFPNGEGFPSVDLVFPPRGDNQRFLEAIQAHWKTELGIHVSITQMEWKVWLDVLKEGDYSLSIDGWNLNNAHRMLQLFVTGSLESYFLWSNNSFDQLFDEATKAITVDERFSKYDQLEKLLAEEVPMIPLSFGMRAQLKHPSVKGWHENPYDERFWKGTYLEAVE